MNLGPNEQAFLTIGALVSLVGLFRILGDIVFTRSRMAGTAQVVEKHYRDISSEYSPPPRKYLLRCVLIEGGKPLTDEMEFEVNRRTWGSAEVGGQIDVFYPVGEHRKMQLALHTRASLNPYLFLVGGLVLIALVALHVLPR